MQLELVHDADYVDLTEPDEQEERRFALGPTPPFASSKFLKQDEDFFYTDEFKDDFLREEWICPSLGGMKFDVEVATADSNEYEVRTRFANSDITNEEAIVRMAQIFRLHFFRKRQSVKPPLLKACNAYLLLTPTHTFWFWDASTIGGKVQLCSFTRCDLRRVYTDTRILVPIRP